MTQWTRRRVLTLGLAPAAVLACAGVGGAELVSRGVLPGRSLLDRLDGACSVPAPPLAFAPPGPAADGTFYSTARRRTVGYTIAYPPGRRPGDDLPLVVMLHAYGGNHAHALAGMSPAQAVALKPGGRPPAPMAMVIGELIPRCQRLGLGRPPRRIAVMGTSMGGFGALLLAEKYPRLFAAVAAVSPAVWTSYPQARRANPGAFASAAAFAAGDVIAHAAALGRRPVRIASAYGDPFYPGVRTLARALPAGAGAVAVFGPGCHDGSFFAAQEPPSLAFLASHLG